MHTLAQQNSLLLLPWVEFRTSAVMSPRKGSKSPGSAMQCAVCNVARLGSANDSSKLPGSESTSPAARLTGMCHSVQSASSLANRTRCKNPGGHTTKVVVQHVAGPPSHTKTTIAHFWRTKNTHSTPFTPTQTDGFLGKHFSGLSEVFEVAPHLHSLWSALSRSVAAQPSSAKS